MFSFPKLQTGLKDKNVYIKQENGRAKVAVDNVVVVDKGNKSGNKSALETCEVNMNSEKVHVSKRQKQEERGKTTGKKWFDMPQQILTPELRRDLQILKLRNVLDPKRFYKREEKGKPRFPKYFQVGTIVEGNTEFYSSRLSKKERATTITGEVMKDLAGRDYYKRKFDEIQAVKQSGGKRFNKKGKGKQSKSWRK
ncbi:MAG: Fcf2 pre-rRNA processing-domain-containing protein [Linnemannia gamsii]|nr:MAG: Fcf2 pre-rRNA processing-domain-containing protein [Linnemannia gamsii]